MQYTEKTIKNIDYINTILSSIEVPSLLNNPDFIVDKSFNYDNYLIINCNKKSCIKLALKISDDGIIIDLDDKEEAIQWNTNDIFSDKKEIIQEWIKIIFTSFVVVKSCGSNYHKFIFMDEEGEKIKSIKYVTGFYLKLNCKSQKYSPVYRQNNM